MIQAFYSGETVYSNSQDAFLSFNKSVYGERQGEVIVYSPFEALFLVKEKRMIVEKNKKFLSFQELLRIFKRKDRKVDLKFEIYADLRKKGYIVKTALKFGADFRVYPKGKKPGVEHAKWIIFCVKQNEKLDWNEFAAKNRIAHSTKKNLLIGIVDEEFSISYYEVSWKKP